MPRLNALLATLFLTLAFTFSAAPSVGKDKEVVEIIFRAPIYSLQMEFGLRGVKEAIVSVCGPGTRRSPESDLPFDCVYAKAELLRLAQHCSKLFIGTIDRKDNFWIPQNYYDMEDTRFIFFHTFGRWKVPRPLMQRVPLDPDSVALLMCHGDYLAHTRMPKGLRPLKQ